MLFSELEEVLEDLSRNKQRLTVSRHAYNILLQDDEIFEPDKKQNRSGGDPSSTLVNQLFQNLYETAESSIWMRLGAEKEKLAEYFHGQENAEACTVAVLALLQEQLEKKARCRQQDKGCSFFVRLSKPVLEALASDELRKDAAFYGDKVGSYLKALLEEYCALPYAERERIYYKQQLQSIELAITRQEKLKLTLNSRKKPTGGRGCAEQYHLPEAPVHPEGHRATLQLPCGHDLGPARRPMGHGVCPAQLHQKAQQPEMQRVHQR